MKISLIAYTPDPEDVIVRAARTCYSRSAPQPASPHDDRSLIRSLLARGHHSVLEHASFSFLLEGLSRASSHQLVRHRLASFSQQSQRYVELEKPEYVIPPSIGEDKRATMFFQEAVNKACDAYKQLLRIGIAREDARYVFPQAVTTVLVFTANARELLHVFRLRLCNRAQWEIREACLEMLTLVKQVAPVIFQEAGPPCTEGRCMEGDGGCGQPWRKITR